MNPKNARLFGWLLFCGILTFSLTACPKKQTVKKGADSEMAEGEEGVMSEETLDIHGKEFIESKELKTVHFGYDSSELTDEARQILAKNAEYLSKNQKLEILAEGHTDERGTVGYNLALGQKRAAAVRKYYLSIGIQPKRIGSLSYGKEKPACNDDGEDCWGKNRRVETKITANKMANGKHED
jgi:peptidoglycan-associated lipoprotein